MTMSATSEKPSSVTRNGVTITVTQSTHDDWSTRYGVEVRDEQGARLVAEFSQPDEAKARAAANKVWRAAGAKYVADSYGNPALVTSERNGRTQITMLTGSDRGRPSSVSRQVVVPVTAWIARTAAEYV